MIILHIAPFTLNKTSGLSVVIPKIIDNQNKIENVKSGLLNIKKLESEKEKKFSFPYMEYNNIKGKFCLDDLTFPFDNPDIVVFHSVYATEYRIISKILSRKKIPYVIFPHGALTLEAQKRSRLKKILANNLYFKKFYDNAEKFQYLSEGEAFNSSKWKKDYITIGNGIELPKHKQINKVDNLLKINFIGRLDISHKGIDYMLDGIIKAKGILEKYNSILNIYGPDFNGGESKIRKIVTENGLENIVKIKGPVYDLEKDLVYSDTDLYILLSRHEGLPTTVLEALSFGVPCLLSSGTNLAIDVEKNNCGWKTETSPKAIADKLEEILNLYPSVENYKKNAVQFVLNNYTWEKVSQQAVEHYSKIIETER